MMEESAQNTEPTSQNSVEERHLEITRGKPPDEWDSLLLGEGEAPEAINEKDKDIDAFLKDTPSLGGLSQTETIAPAQGL